MTVLVLFCGGGGSSLGIHWALPSVTVVGIDSDADSCATHTAHGWQTIKADVADLSPRNYGPASGLWASPPCTAWSSAGKRQAVGRTDEVLRYIADWRIGDGVKWRGDDPLVWLVTEPLRWALTLMPKWVACEQVPAVLPAWEATADRLRAVGYSTWTGVLNSADHGVPQTRERAILMASRVWTVHPPVRTHAEYPHPRLYGVDELPWVSMADALGWKRTDVTHIRMDNRANAAVRRVSEPSPPVLASHDNGNCVWVLDTHRGQDADGSTQTRPLDRPAPSVTGKAASQWAFGRPATTVMGDGRVFPPDGHHAYQGRGSWSTHAIKVTLEELATLQGFPSGYQFAGNKRSRARQIGNAVPPALAEAVVRALTEEET